MSLYEIYWRLNRITKRTNSNREFTAALHGIELKKPVEEMKKTDESLTDDQKKALRIALDKAKERKRLEFQRGG
jgi:hypothetical protein|tara:strand:- start:144 stop:365 length:222 start_codon:yes stop_codon:yes gene_type:complete